ncbi:YncE family protein [[Mycobacterium] burgundiense]|uniref:YncE family protein n=1 Tax=[Mycobacterium] burgundiense TaxID=3064286 RepID=A0ABM9LER6_9MYCO|nr:hypothetical protein [Mycolicibacterium sp. MU0053]CAJ1497712.1 hypothetical protein MU0053_000977 [Mycolicibacterium sp. MU0053]
MTHAVDGAALAARADVGIAPVALHASLAQDAPGFIPARAVTVTRGAITALAELDGCLLTANYGADTVSVRAAQTLGQVTAVDDIYEPTAIVTAGRRAYVASVEPAYDTVTVLERAAVVARIPVRGTVRDLAVSPDARRVYALQADDAAMSLGVIDTETHDVRTVDLTVGPHTVPTALDVAPTGNVVYVAAVDDATGVVLAVRDGRVIGAGPIPSMVRDIVVSRDGRTIFAVSDDDEFGGVVDLLDAETLQITGTIELGAPVGQVSVSADGERAYIVNGSCITVLCTATRRLIDRIETGVDPVTAVESLDGSLLFVADNEGRVASLTVNVTTNKALAQILDADVIDLPMHELEAAAV